MGDARYRMIENLDVPIACENFSINAGGSTMKFTEAISTVLSLTNTKDTYSGSEACDVIEDFMEQWSGAIKEMEERE